MVGGRRGQAAPGAGLQQLPSGKPKAKASSPPPRAVLCPPCQAPVAPQALLWTLPPASPLLTPTPARTPTYW